MNTVLQEHTEIESLYDRHFVNQLSEFGSVIRSVNDLARSDIYFLITFLPVPVETYFDNHLSLLEKLEEIISIENRNGRLHCSAQPLSTLWIRISKSCITEKQLQYQCYIRLAIQEIEQFKAKKGNRFLIFSTKTMNN